MIMILFFAACCLCFPLKCSLKTHTLGADERPAPPLENPNRENKTPRIWRSTDISHHALAFSPATGCTAHKKVTSHGTARLFGLAICRSQITGAITDEGGGTRYPSEDSMHSREGRMIKITTQHQQGALHPLTDEDHQSEQSNSWMNERISLFSVPPTSPFSLISLSQFIHPSNLISPSQKKKFPTSKPS